MKPKDQPMICHALMRFMVESSPWLMDLVADEVHVVLHRGLATPYCTFVDSNIIYSTFNPLKNQ